MHLRRVTGRKNIQNFHSSVRRRRHHVTSAARSPRRRRHDSLLARRSQDFFAPQEGMEGFLPSITTPAGACPARDYFFNCDHLPPPKTSVHDACRMYRKKRTCHCWSPSFWRKNPGAALLSRTRTCSTIAAETLNYRVREGNECCNLAIGTGKIWNKEEMLRDAKRPKATW